MSVTSANRLELLQIADAVAREKMIDPSLVIEARCSNERLAWTGARLQRFPHESERFRQRP